MQKPMVLIAGGSGLLGKAICHELNQQGYETRVLTRNKSRSDQHGYAFWNPEDKEIDLSVFLSATHLINLCGEPIVGRWTKTKKARILSSRIDPIAFLASLCAKHQKHFEGIVCASAIGYYPQTQVSHALFQENQTAGTSFLSNTVKQWEEANASLSPFGLLSQVRIGLVLSKQGGALVPLLKSAQFGLASALGSGKQGFSWIHILDVARIFTHLIQHPTKGIFNAVAPEAVSQKSFTRHLCHHLKKPMFLPPFPSFLLRYMLGSQSSLITHGSYVASNAISNIGFVFEYPSLSQALVALIPKK